MTMDPNRSVLEQPELPITELQWSDRQYITVLQANGVNTVGDLLTGCTGLFLHHFSAEFIKSVRLALAGTGVGLPCFVPPSLFCLAHSTIGGLEPGQPNPPDFDVWRDKLTRPLTLKEEAESKFIEKVRHARGKTSNERLTQALDALTGHDPAKEFFDDADAISDNRVLPHAPVQSSVVGPAFTCTEHASPNLGCRFCIASIIVKRGSYEVSMRVFDTFDSDVGGTMIPIASEDALREHVGRHAYVYIGRLCSRIDVE